ncbi:MAG TPA: V-type ATP synthase subunit E family protein [Planctomycetota bacterium]|nr:V-type ATP synthase subunit E family protein [Planctomycetota bacterium]HRU51709.1 V-type ATP synthase subunit E family protein [Planctomycetota bacterium]
MNIQQLAEKLHQDGIEKGQEEAKIIREKAEQEAQKIIADAEQQAQKILKQAENKITAWEDKSKQNLQLAIRDLSLSIQQNISNMIQNVLSKQVREKLNDAEFVKSLIQSLVQQLKMDSMVIELSEKMQANLRQWICQEFTSQIKVAKNFVGFALQTNDKGFIEVSPDSIVEALLPYLNKEIQNLVQKN